MVAEMSGRRRFYGRNNGQKKRGGRSCGCCGRPTQFNCLACKFPLCGPVCEAAHEAVDVCDGEVNRSMHKKPRVACQTDQQILAMASEENELEIPASNRNSDKYNEDSLGNKALNNNEMKAPNANTHNLDIEMSSSKVNIKTIIDKEQQVRQQDSVAKNLKIWNRKKLCKCCGGVAKYCCPACYYPSCSLKCCKAHKEETGCTGQPMADAMNHKEAASGKESDNVEAISNNEQAIGCVTATNVKEVASGKESDNVEYISNSDPANMEIISKNDTANLETILNKEPANMETECNHVTEKEGTNCNEETGSIETVSHEDALHMELDFNGEPVDKETVLINGTINNNIVSNNGTIFEVNTPNKEGEQKSRFTEECKKKVCKCCGSLVKYRCPACDFPSCSLACSNSHKQETGCDGIRMETNSFVSISEMDDEILCNDYRFLERVKDKLQSCQQNTDNHFISTYRQYTESMQGLPHQLNFYRRDIPNLFKKLRDSAERKQCRVVFQPRQFAKHRENTSYTLFKRDLINWRVRLEFVQAGVRVSTTVDERVTLAELVESYLEHYDVGDSNLREEGWEEAEPLRGEEGAPDFPQMEFYRAVGVAGCTVLFNNEHVMEKNRWLEMDTDNSLQENLAGLCVVEYPVFTIIRKEHLDGFDTTPDREDAELARVLRGGNAVRCASRAPKTKEGAEVPTAPENLCGFF